MTARPTAPWRRPGSLRIPPNLFGIAFGLAGLTRAWHAAGPLLGVPRAVPGAIDAVAATQVGLHAVAEASFGIGILCWLLLGSIVLNRLFFRRWLPDALVPTLAIELAPPAVAAPAYFAQPPAPRISRLPRWAGTRHRWPWSSCASSPATPG